MSVADGILPFVEPRNRASRNQVWQGGELAAWKAYRRRGYRLLARNWRCPLGELDLVLAGRGVVVFCEVKARSSTALGGPYESVGLSKRRKLRALAEAFIKSHRLGSPSYRFDVASVLLGPTGRASVHLFEDAF